MRREVEGCEPAGAVLLEAGSRDRKPEAGAGGARPGGSPEMPVLRPSEARAGLHASGPSEDL